MLSLTGASRRTIIIIDIIFVIIVTLVGLAGVLPPLDGALLVLLLGLAAFRGGRSVAHNMVGRPLREALQVFDGHDGSGAGDSAHVFGKDGIRYVLGNLVSCPICSGTWVSVILIAVRVVSVPVSDAFIYTLAAAGIAEMANWVAQAFEWHGIERRYATGSYIRAEARVRKIEREARELDKFARYGGGGPFGFDENYGKRSET